MAQLIYRSEKPDALEVRYSLQKKVTVVGSHPTSDLVVDSSRAETLLTLTLTSSGKVECTPGDAKVMRNGVRLSRSAQLESCDRLSWDGGCVVFISGDLPISAKATQQDVYVRSFQVLQTVTSLLSDRANHRSALQVLLEAITEISGAESGYLLIGESRGWELLARTETVVDATPREARRELISSTILGEAVAQRQVVCVENLIGHPWSDQASVIAARLFSAACLPLLVGDEVLGAVFLTSRSPGRSIRRDTLGALQVLASQVAWSVSTMAPTRAGSTAASGMLYQDDERNPMREVARKLERLAAAKLNVLILGETGTGKERVARELHARSPRAKEPFVAINCAAIPATLLESILFGHEKGAFTGAHRSQPGKFQTANGGTLFLDEIGDLPAELQVKLLRVLEEKQVEPLGSQQPISVDVRVLAATSIDLASAVKAGKFRSDLLYRLEGARVALPPLRDRKVDIVFLARHFLNECAPTKRFSTEALARLESHPWPGNVRELKQVVERAAALSEGEFVGEADLDLRQDAIASSWINEFEGHSLNEAQEAFTRQFVSAALEAAGGSRAKTAARLGISERTLYRLLSEERPRV
jgi:transcriptional regulator with GAF, ATPase, and Fis domain